MSISTFNFQFYNYKLPAAMPQLNLANSFSELEMDIDDEDQQQQQLLQQPITSTPLSAGKQQKQPTSAATRFTSELSLAVSAPEDCKSPTPSEPQSLRPQLHWPQKRWSMELREKVLEMSKRNNGSDEKLSADPNATFCASANDDDRPAVEITRSVSDRINFFNKLTNTYESGRTQNNNNINNNNNNRFISLLRSSRPQGVATMAGTAVVPPPKPKRLNSTPNTPSQPASPLSFATPTAKPTSNIGGAQRKSSLRRKPSMEKSRATIARQNSNAALRPQRHAMMEDLSLVVPVRLRIAEYEQRISMSA